MKYLRSLIILLLFSVWINVVNAAEPKQQFSLYITNDTPYPIILGLSNWNKTPLYLTTIEVAPNANNVKIGYGDIINSQVDISYYAYIQAGPRNYYNTPVVVYSFAKSRVEADVQPMFLTLNKKKYIADIFIKNFYDLSLDIKPQS